MGRTCKKCGQQTGPDRRLCKMCSLDKRYGNDFETASDVDDEPDELEYRCVKCGHEQVGTLSDDCEECGERRWRYIGPLEDESDHEERVATDGGAEDLIPARVDEDDLIGADCPVCGEEMTPGAIRFNGHAWEHKSDETHPQAGHHRISEPLDEDDEEQLRADGGRPTEEEMLDVELLVQVAIGEAIHHREDGPADAPEVGPPAEVLPRCEQCQERDEWGDDRSPEVGGRERVGSDASQRVGSVV